VKTKPGRAPRPAGPTTPFGASRGATPHRGPTLGELVGPVVPLKPAAKRVAPLVTRRAPPKVAPEPSSRWHGGRAAPSFDVQDDGSHIEGVRADENTALRDLARGHLPIVATFDLHGFTSDEAERKLQRFLERQQGPRRRAVLVVHGRGSHSAGGRGVLRDQIATWLSGPPFADMVLCFATARPRDGGGGALYVLLAPRVRTA
jgi:DNA-nicking Smr family endonuclease